MTISKYYFYFLIKLQNKITKYKINLQNAIYTLCK